MKDEIVVAIVVGVVSGAVGAYVGNSTVRRLQEQIHREELAEADTDGYKRGYDSLASNPHRMRQLLAKISGPDEQEV